MSVDVGLGLAETNTSLRLLESKDIGITLPQPSTSIQFSQNRDSEGRQLMIKSSGNHSRKYSS